MSSQAPKPLIKSVMVGAPESGKTSLMTRYVKNKFEPKYTHTIGADFLHAESQQNGTTITSQIWDISMDERFLSFGLAFYRTADVFIFVYDSTTTASFTYLTEVLSESVITSRREDQEQPPPIMVLVANKSDLNDQNQVVSRKTALKFKVDHQFDLFFEVSAKKGTNINELFTEIHRLAFEKKALANIEPEPEPVPAIHPALMAFLPQIDQYTSKLQRQIDSRLPYPHKERKQQKIDGFNALNATKGDLKTAVSTVQASYPEFLKGKRTRKLITEIELAATQNGLSTTIRK